jgi:hypothetical protein
LADLGKKTQSRNLDSAESWRQIPMISARFARVSLPLFIRGDE